MMFIFVILGLLLCEEVAGSSNVTTVFVQKGKDLHLDVKKPVVLGNQAEFKWTVNNTHNIVRLSPDNETRIIPGYEGRAEVSLQSHSLLLKNVQQSDSGDYTAHITGDEDQCLAEYKVIIQDPVSPVNLSVDSVSNSTESCNLTVSCSTERSHINSTFGCDTQTCYQEGGEQSEVTTSGSSVHVYLLNDSIICNHSNQVSWTKDLKKIQTLCPLNTVSGAVTPVFVKLGDNVLLEVKKPVVLTEEEDFFWRFNTSYSIVKLSYESKETIFKKYSQRAELSDQNHSLLLKNLQQADSGRYVAQVTGGIDRIIAEYKVIVQNPVSPVNLSVDFVSNSTESCNLTVSCRTERSHISSTFRCDTQTCYQKGEEQSEVTTSDSSLCVYLLNDYIICNHSNQIS
ncbi:CD48 antigen-like isoform X2 [Thunnus thynnus]|uniref:CD48 antigen-like isoform X2 n=1 Tax=Thunnus thynnus TaxID=8237 RepID=UPI0035283453